MEPRAAPKMKATSIVTLLITFLIAVGCSAAEVNVGAADDKREPEQVVKEYHNKQHKPEETADGKREQQEEYKLRQSAFPLQLHKLHKLQLQSAFPGPLQLPDEFPEFPEFHALPLPLPESEPEPEETTRWPRLSPLPLQSEPEPEETIRWQPEETTRWPRPPPQSAPEPEETTRWPPPPKSLPKSQSPPTPAQTTPAPAPTPNELQQPKPKPIWHEPESIWQLWHEPESIWQSIEFPIRPWLSPPQSQSPDCKAHSARGAERRSSWITAGIFSFTVLLVSAVVVISWNLQKRTKACYKKASFSKKLK